MSEAEAEAVFVFDHWHFFFFLRRIILIVETCVLDVDGGVAWSGLVASRTNLIRLGYLPPLFPSLSLAPKVEAGSLYPRETITRWFIYLVDEPLSNLYKHVRKNNWTWIGAEVVGQLLTLAKYVRHENRVSHIEADFQRRLRPFVGYERSVRLSRDYMEYGAAAVLHGVRSQLGVVGRLGQLQGEVGYENSRTRLYQFYVQLSRKADEGLTE